MKKKQELAAEWTKREKQDFYRALVTYPPPSLSLFINILLLWFDMDVLWTKMENITGTSSRRRLTLNERQQT